MVGQIIPWNFPILMAAWKLAPALAAGNCVVIKPAEQTPVSLLLVIELIADLLPPGVLNVVNGFGVEAGKPLASSSRVAKVAFTGETTTGRLIMQYASENIIPVTLELGGKSPNIFLPDVMAADDDFLDKAVEGFVIFALNQGEVCTCPSHALIHSSIYDEFMARCVERTKAIVSGDPLDPHTMIGAQASNDQYEKILSYIDIGKQEGAELLTGGAVAATVLEATGGRGLTSPSTRWAHRRPAGTACRAQCPAAGLSSSGRTKARHPSRPRLDHPVPGHAQRSLRVLGGQLPHRTALQWLEAGRICLREGVVVAPLSDGPQW